MQKTRKTLWAWTLGTFFGAGFGRPGPGTYGSCAAVLLWLVAAHTALVTPLSLRFGTLIAAIVATLIGIPAATRVARESGRKDPSIVVIDEVAGQWIALLFAAPTIPQALIALLLFRAFDIWKPGPVRRLEALPEGTGIMLDDVAAGILALLVFLVLRFAIPLSAH
jgi:phosphatidylglycerophosphatase A